MRNDVDIGGNKPLSKEEQDRTDLANEMAGREAGRINRFLPDNASPAELKKRREREYERLSALITLLQSDPDYAALYNHTMDQLQRAEAETAEALSKANETLQQAQHALAELSDEASSLPDGTKVFRDAGGNVWNERGEPVTGMALEQIVWHDTAPRYEDYLAKKKAVEQARRDVDAIRHYQVGTLGSARDRLSDEDNPPSKDDLKEFQKRIEQEMPSAIQPTKALEQAPEVTGDHRHETFELPPIKS
ncbi:MAG: hypothetical protein GKS00_11410 [Alphaproteobacteria bacterium]|nr:hypothetical protein [Alphaproteobacteria bacterium]NKC02274.1 hypothetical protein [Pseudomonadales bacterium]